MTQEDLKREVMTALATVQDPATDNDIVAAGRVRDVTVGDAGDVIVTVSLGPSGQGAVGRGAWARR